MNDTARVGYEYSDTPLADFQRRLWHDLCRERIERPWRVPSVAELARRAGVREGDALDYFASCELARVVHVYPAWPADVDVATAETRSHEAVRAGIERPLAPAMRIAPSPDWPHLHPAPVVHPRDAWPCGPVQRIDIPGVARLRLHYRPDGDIVVRTVWDLRPHGEEAR